MDTVVRLPDGASAEIDERGYVAILQDAGHAITLSPEQMYLLTVWAVERLSTLDHQAYVTSECFECRGPVAADSHVYRLDEGDILLCGPCAHEVGETVLELQQLM